MVVLAASTKMPLVPKLFVASVLIVASVAVAFVTGASLALTPMSVMPAFADAKNSPN